LRLKLYGRLIPTAAGTAGSFFHCSWLFCRFGAESEYEGGF
jgi:hypothetical protein